MDARRRCYRLLPPIILDIIESEVVQEDSAWCVEMVIREILAEEEAKEQARLLAIAEAKARAEAQGRSYLALFFYSLEQNYYFLPKFLKDSLHNSRIIITKSRGDV